MKFSIIIPCYRVEKYLHQCVESICNQSFHDIEVILVDDGSPDSCPQICDELAKNDNRIIIIHKENGGLSDARNVGLKYSTGDFVVFLDSDDWWCDLDALKKINERLEKSNADVLIFQSKKYYQLNDTYIYKKVTKIEYRPRFLYDIEYLMRHSLFVACAWDKVIRRSVLVDNKIDFVVGQVSEDIEWCCKLLELNLSYTVVEDVYHVYRQQNGTSITANITNKNLFDIQKVVLKWAERSKEIQKEPIRHFLALELVLWCAISNKATDVEGEEIISSMSKAFYLIHYKWYPRVALVSKLSFLGFRIFRRLIVLGYRLKWHK
jgi:glycosyltransferase involved in cell wall biosynthesis